MEQPSVSLPFAVLILWTVAHCVILLFGLGPLSSLSEIALGIWIFGVPQLLLAAVFLKRGRTFASGVLAATGSAFALLVGLSVGTHDKMGIAIGSISGFFAAILGALIGLFAARDRLRDFSWPLFLMAFVPTFVMAWVPFLAMLAHYKWRMQSIRLILSPS